MTLALYVPRASVVHRTPAGVKLAALAALGVLLFAVPTLAVAAGALASVLLVGLAAAISMIQVNLLLPITGKSRIHTSRWT